jgi:multiple RNA-binding domain-containing protein 1
MEETAPEKTLKPKTPREIKTAVRDTLFTLKLRGLTYKSKKKDIKQFFHPTKPKSIRLCPKVKGIAYVGFVTEKDMKKALNKNKSILGTLLLFVLFF